MIEFVNYDVVRGVDDREIQWKLVSPSLRSPGSVVVACSQSPSALKRPETKFIEPKKRFKRTLFARPLIFHDISESPGGSRRLRIVIARTKPLVTLR